MVGRAGTQTEDNGANKCDESLGLWSQPRLGSDGEEWDSPAGGITYTTALRGGTITTIAAPIRFTTGGDARRGTASAVSTQRTIGQARSTMIMVRT